MNKGPYKILENSRISTDKQYYPWVLLDKFQDEVALFHEKNMAEVVRDFLNGGDKVQYILDVVFEYADNNTVDMVRKVLERYES